MKQPKLRFPEFTGDWKQHKFEDVVTIGSGKDYKHLESGNVPVYGTGGYMLSVNQALSESEDAVGIGRKGTIDKPYILRAPFWTVDTLFYCIPNKGFDLTFTNCLFQNVDWKKKDESTGVPSLSKVIINNVKTYVPSLEEQQKIASLFSELDTLIQSAEKELDGYREFKQGMLQKMFPKKGETTPEIRFPEFTGDWEQRKVTALGEVYIGLVTTMTAHYTNQGTLLIRNSDIKNGKFEFDSEPIYLDKEFAEQNKSRMHKIGDVITVHTGDIGTSAVIGENEVNSIGFATIVTRPNLELLDSNYLSTFLNTDQHKVWAVQMSTGDGRTNYNLKDYTELIVPVPKLEEQRKIASFILNLNNLITLHQRELDGYKELKKGLLQQMFC